MSDFELQNEEDKREFRRKRRVRNQILAYATLVLILLVVSVAGFFAIKAGSAVMAEKEQQKLEEEMSAQTIETMTQMSETEDEPETVIEEETTTVEEYTDEELLDEIVDACISEMSLEDKVAGLFIVTPEALTGVDKAVRAGDGTKEALEKYPVGGLIYFKQNIQSKDQITQMLANTVSMSKYPIFLAVDEEGAKVARVADALGLEKVYSAADMGAAGDANNAYNTY